jgi:type IV pilus biogenesis protein CpaD/CtpE
MRLPKILAAASIALLAGCASEPEKLTTSALRPRPQRESAPATREVKAEAVKSTPEDAKRSWCQERQHKLERGQITGETLDRLKQMDDYCRGA